MRFSISINDAWSGQSVADAKIYLRVGEMEQSAKSDADGKFFREDDREYIGQNLLCRVERQGYELWETSTQVDRDEIHLNVDLTPETIELVFKTVDIKDKPLKGVEVSIDDFGQHLTKAIADSNGVVRVLISGQFSWKTLNYRAECQGFVPSSGEFQLKVNVSPIISLQKIDMEAKDKWKILKRFFCIIFPILIYIVLLNFARSDLDDTKFTNFLLIGCIAVGCVSAFICWWRTRRLAASGKNTGTGK